MAGFLERIRRPSAAPKVEIPSENVSEAPPVELDPKPKPPVFSSDSSDDRALVPDAMGVAPLLRRLAELSAHAGTQTPLSVGIFGPAGAGKSFAISHLLADVRAFAAAAAGAPNGPFLSRIVTARVDASASADPATAIAAAVHKALHFTDGTGRSFAHWADDATYVSGDPQQAVRDASDRVADLRRRLDSEKQALQEVQSRRARLTENVLYDAAGTRIDSFARNNRTSIESRLEGFGFTGSDPIATYKDLVRDYNEKNGFFSRTSVLFHSLWAFRGQMRLIFLAIMFAAFAWLMQQCAVQAPWVMELLGRIEGQFSSFATAIGWVRTNGATFTLLENVGLVAAAGVVVLNVFRAFRFLAPIRRGVRLLNADMDVRRRDLDNLIASQSQRTDDLSKEIERQSALLAEAERRADAARSRPDATLRSPFGTQMEGAQGHARAFIEAITAKLADATDTNGPQRIVVAIDNLDATPASQALAFARQARSLLAASGIASIFAADPEHLKAALAQEGVSDASAANAIARLVQAPFRLGARGRENRANLVKSLIGETDQKALAAPDATASALDEPMRPGESDLLAKLSDLAGETPRQIKRYVNTYRILRTDAPVFAPLALALAVQSGGAAAEKQEFADLVARAGEDGALDGDAASPRLAAAIRAASGAQTFPLTGSGIREAMTKAAAFSGDF